MLVVYLVRITSRDGLKPQFFIPSSRSLMGISPLFQVSELNQTSLNYIFFSYHTTIYGDFTI